MSQTDFKILEPITVGGVEFKNRIMFPPLTTGYEERDGSIGERSRAFYTRLAQGGAGYIVLGDVAPIASFSPTPKLFCDEQIESFKQLADAVHEYGCKLGVQIFHPEYDCDAINALFREGKMNEVRARMHHDMEHFTDEVSEETLLAIIDKMCACAVRAQKAGVDVIQVHGDRLVGCLTSTRMNHRTDKFGGSLENRTRFALMLVKALRDAVPDMVIDYKLPIVTPERGKGGIDLEDAPQFAQWLEEAGVDMLHVAQANHTGNMADTIPPMGVQPYGFFVDITGQIKQAVSIPVSAVGRIVDPYMAERVVVSGKADMVGIGRGFLADEDWVRKVEDGRADQVIRCLSCNKGCTDAIQRREGLSCVLNPENGYETVRHIVPTDAPKRVAVVGGGIAGLMAARVAALRGHEVTLFERATELGGQLNIACVPPRKCEIRRAVQDAVRAAEGAGVTFQLGRAVEASELAEAGFERVIVAVGAECAVPPIKGADGVNVADSWLVLAGTADVYGKVAVIGGGMVGCETAELLADAGCEVSVVEMLDAIAADEGPTVKPTLFEHFAERGVQQFTQHKVLEITPTELVCEGPEGEVRMPIDYAVMAIGAKRVTFDTAPLDAAGVAWTFVGDCSEEGGDISRATKTAYDAAAAL
ncbi:MAG: NAD(P)/FAD-dependent oxidoreductase [Coriobacteriaceae bacterium]|nr:NAD(P)/FAD-dependent oxidoreductase [Coriobacteriaceae bacterium]